MYGGDGLTRLVTAPTNAAPEGGMRRVALAPYVLPGERVRLRAVREKPALIRAAPVAILEPSPARVEPKCPYFGRCGGCHYQHASYAAQLEAKRAILVEELWRQAKIRIEAEVAIVSSEPWGYRNRVQLHVDEHGIGYREAGSHKLCPIERCPIASPKINETIAQLNTMRKDRRWPRFLRSLEIFTDEERVQVNVLEATRPVARHFFEWCAQVMPGFEAGALDYRGEFRVSGNSFFQVNRFLLDRLVEAALEGVEGEWAVELYAGVGLFTQSLARRFRLVTAVESGAGAVRDLRWNAERAGLANIEAKQQPAEKFLAALEATPDFLLLDPPRAGLGAPITAQLARLGPRAMTIVACDPVTLARDLAALTAAGFRIDRLSLVDLFPQTYHLETIVRLVRT